MGFASLLCFILCKHACGRYENFRGAFTEASAGHDSFVYDGIGILERCLENIKSLRASISLQKSFMLFQSTNILKIIYFSMGKKKYFRLKIAPKNKFSKCLMISFNFLQCNSKFFFFKEFYLII